jgi:hypothetical protein
VTDDELKALTQERDWLRRHYDNLREWLPKHPPCLFCASDIEMRPCKCGGAPFMNLNDIYYAFFCGCQNCGRGASVVGYGPFENHDRCVKLWNSKGWCADSPVKDDHPDWIDGNPPPPEPEKPSPTLQERLEAFKIGKRGSLSR